jgi:hypothetical protein
MARTGGYLDVRRLTVIGGAAAYDARIDGTAVSARSAGAGFEFPAGIRLLAGQVLSLTPR